MNIPVKDNSCPETPSGFALIYEKHFDALYQNVFLITKCQQTSEDIVHDVFINFWMKREKLAEIKDIPAYLFLMSRNFAFDYLRRKKLEQHVFKNLVYSTAKEFIDDSYIEKEFKMTVDETIAQLPSRQQLIYRLKREEGWSRNEIAQSLNISEHTVRVTMQKALKTLKENAREVMVAWF